MFARIVEVPWKIEKKDELLKMVRQDILPVLRKQPGFLELMPFVPEIATEHMFAVTLWAEKRDAEKYVHDVFPRIEQMLKPFVTMPITVRTYTVETSVCKHLVEALIQAA